METKKQKCSVCEVVLTTDNAWPRRKHGKVIGFRFECKDCSKSDLRETTFFRRRRVKMSRMAVEKGIATSRVMIRNILPQGRHPNPNPPTHKYGELSRNNW